MVSEGECRFSQFSNVYQVGYSCCCARDRADVEREDVYGAFAADVAALEIHVERWSVVERVDEAEEGSLSVYDVDGCL